MAKIIPTTGIPPTLMKKYGPNFMRDLVADAIAKAWFRMGGGLMRSKDARNLAVIAMSTIKLTATAMRREIELAKVATNEDEDKG